MTDRGPLADALGRVHNELRISVTDRCNLRCRYCMPEEGVGYRSHDEILSYEEIHRVARVAIGLGVTRIRLTGGEPLVRKGVCRLVEGLAGLPGLEDLAMTTNGVLLAEYALELRSAGLRRLNVSLDTLDRLRFAHLARRDELPRVLEGIAAARNAGFERIKLNAVAIRGQREDDVAPLARFARENRLELRFIEFMPLDADEHWEAVQVLSSDEILAILTRDVGPLEPVPGGDPHATSVEHRFLDGQGGVGLIRSVSRPFCDRCNRLRLTADGRLRNCLFSREECELRSPLRSGVSDEDLAALIRGSVVAKKACRGADDGQLARPGRTMHQIGG